MLKTKLISVMENDEQGLDFLVNNFITTDRIEVVDVKFSSVIHPHIESYGWDPTVQHSALIIYKEK